MTTETINWEQRLKQEQVIWRYAQAGPHALYGLASFGAYKKHSNFYFNSDYLTSNPRLMKEIAAALHQRLQARIERHPAWIVTYAPYGLNLAHCLADLFECQVAYVPSLDNPEILLDIQAEDAVLFCADDLQTGGSLRKTAKAVEEKGARIMSPICVVANLSGSEKFDEYDVVSLLSTEVELWDPESCPFCMEGSMPLPARKNWKALQGKTSGEFF